MKPKSRLYITKGFFFTHYLFRLSTFDDSNRLTGFRFHEVYAFNF